MVMAVFLMNILRVMLMSIIKIWMVCESERYKKQTELMQLTRLVSPCQLKVLNSPALLRRSCCVKAMWTPENRVSLIKTAREMRD